MKYDKIVPLWNDGLEYRLPTPPDEKLIDGYNLPKKKQRFMRKQFLSEEEFAQLTKSSQLDILTEELIKRSQGHWFFNNGVPTYLTGSHYFYLNYWYMAAMTPDGMPQYRWAMNRVSYFVDLCEKDNNCFGGIMLSQKRFGKTEFFLAHLYNQATLIETDCLFGMQSLSSTEAKNNLFKGRILRSHRRIPNYLKPKSNDTIGTKEISAELTFMGEKNGNSYTRGLQNKIDWRPTLASAYQGKRPREVYWDEAGTIDEMNIYDSLSTVKQQLQIGKRAFGKIFMPATIEEMTPKGAPLFEKIWHESDPKVRDANGRTVSWLYRYFNPQHDGREDFVDEYGNSLVEEAKIFRSNELAVASPAKQKKIKRQYPEDPDEAFDVVVSDFFEEDVRDILGHVRKELMGKTLPIKKMAFYELGNDVQLKPDQNNEMAVSIFEDPKPHVKYYASFDGTGSDKDTGNEDGSAVSVTVLKGADSGSSIEYCPVAYFKFRPQKMEDGYRITLLLSRHYGKHGNYKLGIERNAGQGSPLIAFFINRGFRKLLMKKQRITGVTDGGSKELFGWYRNEEVKDVQKSLTNSFLRLHAHNIPFVEVIDSLIAYGRSNQDIADSFIGAVYTMGTWDKNKVSNRIANTLKWKFKGLKRDPSGRTQEVWVQE